VPIQDKIYSFYLMRSFLSIFRQLRAMGFRAARSLLPLEASNSFLGQVCTMLCVSALAPSKGPRLTKKAETTNRPGSCTIWVSQCKIGFRQWREPPGVPQGRLCHAGFNSSRSPHQVVPFLHLRHHWYHFFFSPTLLCPACQLRIGKCTRQELGRGLDGNMPFEFKSVTVS
jgi:hypothetical protein